MKPKPKYEAPNVGKADIHGRDQFCAKCGERWTSLVWDNVKQCWWCWEDRGELALETVDLVVE